MRLGFTDHLEAPRDQSSADVFRTVEQFVRCADEAGADFFWFTEHHSHLHYGHLPTPLLFAMHMAAKTRHIRPGTAVICLNLHHPLDAAEQVAVADHLSDGRLAPGFGSGSTPREFALFGKEETPPEIRHAQFREGLDIILNAWSGHVGAKDTGAWTMPAHDPLPKARLDLHGRCWIACNSEGSAKIAGEMGFNILFSHLRTPEQNAEYCRVYRAAGGTGEIALNRPVLVAHTDVEARRLLEPTLRTLWRRFQSEGKIPAEKTEPETLEELAVHPINFLFGSPETVTAQLAKIRTTVPYSVVNVEANWSGLSDETIMNTIRLMACDVVPGLNSLLRVQAG